MPLVDSNYKSPWYFRNGHIQTILPALFRQVTTVYERETIGTNDGDFLDLDWCKVGGELLVLISHGLEGSSDTAYCKAMARAANQSGYDALVWNYRGCSGRINKKMRYYHSGDTFDLHSVITHVEISKCYKAIVLIGYSVGGNITLKYLGEKHYHHSYLVKMAITCSVPCNLEATAHHLKSFIIHKIYLNRFLKSLKHKMIQKAQLFPEIDVKNIDLIKDFKEFDDTYTAPMFGYVNAIEYWENNSCNSFLPNIKLTSFLIMAQNDPFFPIDCYPISEAKNSDFLHLELPKFGGHCGFGIPFLDKQFWFEKRAIHLIKNFT